MTMSSPPEFNRVANLVVYTADANRLIRCRISVSIANFCAPKVAVFLGAVLQDKGQRDNSRDFQCIPISPRKLSD